MNSLIPPLECRIYLLRKTSFTWDEIHKLDLSDFWGIYKELIFQENMEEYQRQINMASLKALIANAVPRKKGASAFTYKDFYKGEKPTRNQQVNEFEALAKKHGIRLPDKELKKRGGD